MNPGSQEARNEGCTCSVMDNHYGSGRLVGASRQFFVDEGCPVHDPADAADSELADRLAMSE